MTYTVRGFGLAASLVLVFAFCATPAAAQVVVTSTTASTAAYVYIQIQGPQGAVYGFRASSTGRVSTIPGSPFKPAGEIVGSTPTKFFTLGKDLIHSYGIASDGAIGSQLSQIPFFEYAEDGCGPSGGGQGGAVLDHTGKYIYVRLGCVSGNNYSVEYQSYVIHSDGAFSYDGDTVSPPCSTCIPDLPSILGNESFAYADVVDTHQSSLIGFQRTSAGTLELMQFTESDPPSDVTWDVYRPDASPTGNYLVAELYPEDTYPAHLASYAVGSSGDISTTNTSSNMPTTGNTYTTFSPSGDLFVACGDGIEVYKFNGAAPLTFYKALLRGTYIDEVKWDGSNHLYAISTATNKLYLFTVTSASIAFNSSVSISSPYKMLVVSK